MVTAPAPSRTDGQDGPTLATAELELEGMHCSACATRIQRSLGRLPAVASASVNLATTRAFVSYDADRIGLEETVPGRVRRRATRRRRPTPTVAATEHDPDHWVRRAAISWPLAMAAVLVSVLAPETAPRPAGPFWCWPSSSRSPAVGPSCATAPACSGTAPPAWTPSSPWAHWPRWRSAPSRPSPWAGGTCTWGRAAPSPPDCTG